MIAKFENNFRNRLVYFKDFKYTMAGSVVGSNNQSYQLLLSHYQTALLNILPERCCILTQLLQDSPVKELQYIFPALVEHIFGFRSGIDWGLLSLDKDLQLKDFEAVRRFLMPDGPIFKLVSKFTEEFSPKFEFPLSCIPTPSQLMLQEGKVPALYANKFQIVNPGLFPSTVQLNAFEYYFFHFAYFIVNPSLKNSLANVRQQETLYAHLLEDYLCSFLPSDGRAVPLYQTPHSVQHSPIMTSSLSSNFGSPHGTSDIVLKRSLLRPDSLTPVMQKPSLLKKGTVMMVASPGSYGSSQAECWKSETFLLILKEMYLNQNSLDHQQNILDLTTKTFIPTHYHVWMVRILVKHLHFFFNSSLYSSHVSGHGQIMIDSLGRLKSLGITQLIEREMYCFLKSTFDHWPLDASFRVPLETWLSYIQPWRYVQCDLDLAVWQKFVNENVFFYTSLLQLVIKRFLRMDFNCPKNAFMLYRVSKVFALTENCPDRELREMIQQAEKAVCTKPSSLGMSSLYIHRSPEKSYSFRKVSFLEGPGTTYTSLFSEPVLLMVSHLLSSVAAALEKAQYNGVLDNSKNNSFLSKIYNLFDMSDGYNSDDNSPADIKKMTTYLEASINQLCMFFKEVNRPVLNTSQYMPCEDSHLSILNNNYEKGNNSAIRELTFTTKCSISNTQYQMLNKKRKPEIVCQSNPDLQPVRSYEVAHLVTFFNNLSLQLNEKHATQIHKLYHQPTVFGKVCRKVFAKPVRYYSVAKSKNMESVTQSAVYLPPRIHLRFLANKHLISYWFGLLLITYWFGYNPIFTILVLFLMISFFIFAAAILFPVPIESKQD